MAEETARAETLRCHCGKLVAVGEWGPAAWCQECLDRREAERQAEYPTVAELVRRLSTFPPDAQVGVRAFCCSSVHAIKAVRSPTMRDNCDGFVGVVIDAEE